MGGRDLVLTFGIGAQQRTVTDQVNQSRHTMAGTVQSPNGAIGKNFAAKARHAEPVTQVGFYLRAAEGVEVITRRHPLIQLSQFRQCQDVRD